MEFMISISRPGKSWNFSEGHGKSWKSNMLLENKRQKDKKLGKKTDESETGFNFSRNKDKHCQNKCLNFGHGKLGKVMESHGILKS